MPKPSKDPAKCHKAKLRKPDNTSVYVDLHIHSFYSDGTMSPRDIAEAAQKSGVGLLAVTDHNSALHYPQIRDACQKRNIKCIPAVEIDCLDGERYYHVLAYGFNTRSQAFHKFLRHTRFMLDELSVKLVERMQEDYSCVSLKDYMDYRCDRRLGGWKALHYFYEKGLTASIKEGIALYPQYGVIYQSAGYATVGAVAYRIHRAGGYAVLAHPGEMINTTDTEAFKAELIRTVSLGLDGVECYYPTHTSQIQDICLNTCRANNKLITAGSDCHGSFGDTQIGELKTTAEQVTLGNLML